MLIKTFGSAVYGVNAQTITIEVNIAKGVNYFLVGLPDSAIKESQKRIESALHFFGYKVPIKTITVNLAPADIRKEGSAYDLPIAIGILCASEQLVAHHLSHTILMGELALDGQIRPIRGALPIALQAKKDGFTQIIIPSPNAIEASVLKGIDIIPVNTISEVINHLNNSNSISPIRTDFQSFSEQNNHTQISDFSEVRGQEGVKRGMEIAASGGHNIILIGPPGSGKTMIAKRLPGILPPLSLDEALETTAIHSVIGQSGKTSSLITQRPFRHPHHTVSDVALVGGGSFPRPGEISLAHNGVLFLDELPEFKRTVLEVLRQPLEDRQVTISRAKITVDFPASFMLVASMNPSPSGDFYDPNTSMDSEMAVKKYLNKISGPLLDRIDLHIEVSPVPFEKLNTSHDGMNSAEMRKRVLIAREIQSQRFSSHPSIFTNSQLTPRLVKQFCKLDPQGENLMKNAMEKMGFSARSFTRILKVARTISDMENSEKIQAKHVAEAIQYRGMDRDGWLG